MKKIFLVDDEIVVREGIRNCIDWTREGFIYCGDAPDGEIALPLIEKHQPDIVITDIKMPFMDGLEISRILREKMPSIKIIILSGHDEFEYAREALRIQIFEYCLKPISSIELLQILNKIAKEIDDEAMERKSVNELKNQALKNENLTRDKFLKELCEGYHSTTTAIKEATKIGINLISNHYAVLILEGDEDHIANMIPIKALSFISFRRTSKETVFIFRGDSKKQLEELFHNLRDYFGESYKYGIGNIKDRIQEISQSFSEAYDEKYQSISYEKLAPLHTLRAKELNFLFNRKDFENFLKFGNKDDIRSFCINYSSLLKEKAQQSPFMYYYFVMQVTTTTLEFVNELDNNTAISNKIKNIEIKTTSIRDYNQVIEYMRVILESVIKHRIDTKSKNYPIIQKAKDYIQKHYNNPELSLQMISDVVNISPSYFSHLFSQETGQTLKEYLTNIRIDKAKELLLTTHEKTYEIALKVGYNDSHYFCNTFKKITGMTTKKFKSEGQTTVY